MTRSLLYELNTPKALRQALVLFTMLLLPSTAWAEYTLGSGETLTFMKVSDDLGQYSSPEGSVWNVTLTAIEGSATTSKLNDNNFIHFSELRLTSPIPYNGTMSGFTFSGTVSIVGDGSSALYPNVDQILVYKSSSASDFSGRTLIGEVTKSGGSYTYASQSSNPTVLNNEYIQVVFLRTTVNTNNASVAFPAENITGITMTFDGTSYGIKVGNQRVTSNNSTDILGDGGKVSYDNTNNTLTLNGATIDGCIRYSGTNGLNIQFEGNNIITAVDSAAIRTVYLSSATPSQLPSLVLSGSGNAKLSSRSYVGYSAIAGFSQINGGLSAAYLVDYTGADFTSLTGEKDIIICNGRPYGFYVGGTIVTESNKATVLGSGVDFTPATTSEATLIFSDKATIPGNLDWDMNNALKIQLTGANTVQGCIHSNKDVALSFTYPSGATNSCLAFGNSEGTQSAISGFTEITFPEINSQEGNKLSFDENVSYNTSDKALKDDENKNVSLVHISYHYGLNIYKGNTLQMSFSAYNQSFNHESAGIGEFTSGMMYFDSNSNTLTLTGVTISDGIILWENTTDLKIALSGNSKITCSTAMTITRDGSSGNTYQNPSPIISGAEVAYWKTDPAPSQRENEPILQFTSAGQGSCSLILSKSGTNDCIQGFYFPNNSPVDGTLSHAETTDNEGGGHADMLISSEFYNIWVNNIQVHGIEGYPRGYKENVTEETNPTVTYNPTDEILTLNGATISINAASDYNAIESKIDNLTVHLIGTNQITCTGSSTNYAFYYSGDKTSVTVTFTTDAASPGSLAGTVDNPDHMYDYKIDPKYKNGLGYTSNGSDYTIKVTEYGLKINNQQLTSSYIDTDGSIKDIAGITGTVKFTSAVGSTPATLTMTNNAEITGGIICSMESLNIALDGTSSIANINSVAIEAESTVSSTLSFIKATGAESCKLTISGRGGAIQGFTSATYVAESSGLYYLASENTSVVTSSVLGGGSGTSADPYLITSPDELKDFATYVNNKLVTNQYFKLTKNIDCDGLEGFESIGSSSPFIGTLSGNGNTINNLTINSGLGFFGHISGGTVNDLNFYKLRVTGNSYATGGIASELSAGGQIDNCTLTECTIACLDNQYSPEVGGIVARLSGSGSTISNCVVYNSTINASTTYTGGSGPIGYAGGIVASYSSGTITNCHVKDDSKIINVNADGSSTLKTGALVGNVSSDATTSITSNFYYYNVTVETQLGSSAKETKSGYTPRGTNNNTDPDGAMLYTKEVIIPISTDAGHVSIGSDYYYKVTSDDTNTTYSVAPDVEVVISVENADVEGSYTLEGAKTIELKPKEGSTGLYTFDMPNADVTFTVQEAAAVHFSEEGQVYASYYNATKDVAVPMGMTAYIVTGVSEDGTKVIVSPVSYIKKGVAVLIEKDKTTEVSETTDFSGSKLIYAENDVPVTTGSKLYVLYQNQFVKVTSGTQIPTGKNYLDLSTFTNAGTRGFYDIGGANDGTSALRGVVAEGTNGKSDAWYTLQGRRLSAKPSAHGLYLHNGIKVVVK